jgi:hypothetical protein
MLGKRTSDKRMRQEGMSNRDKTFTWDPLMLLDL